MRILLVEDNELLGEAICSGLRNERFTVDWIQNGLEAQRAVLPGTENFDAIILDLGLPGKSGLAVLKSIRDQKITTPVIILTATDDIETRIKGLDAGANDFIAKPFNFLELKARINAQIRSASARTSNTIQVGRVRLDTQAHEVRSGNQIINLSKREFSILQKLLEQAGKVVARDQISQIMYGWGDESDSNTIEVYIHSIRKKLGENLKLRTIRGVGYIIDEENE